MFKSKKAIVTHPGFLFLAGVAIGFILAILFARGVINVPFNFVCP